MAYRTIARKPILWTSNIDAGGLKNAMGEDKGPAFIRRIREFTNIVAFKDGFWWRKSIIEDETFTEKFVDQAWVSIGQPETEER